MKSLAFDDNMTLKGFAKVNLNTNPRKLSLFSPVCVVVDFERSPYTLCNTIKNFRIIVLRILAL